MSDQFLAEIRIFPFAFAPKGWANCIGQLLPISQNTALFSLLGTYYGGDGKSNFGLPDFKETAPIQQGQGPDLSPYDLGQTGGEAKVALQTQELPAHRHDFSVTTNTGTTYISANAQLASGVSGTKGASNMAACYSTQPVTTPLNPAALAEAGNSVPHNNMMPYLTMNFCIALQGIFPPRG